MMNRCLDCNGSGQIMGGGMIMDACSSCDGSGKSRKEIEDIPHSSIKKTEGYKKAKARLQAKHENLSDEEAEKLLDEAFENEKPRSISRRKKNVKE